MHFSTIAITLLGAAASASASIFARQSLPSCAVTCTASANLGGCVATDTHCLCTNVAFINSTTSCIESACTGSDLQTALAASQQLCAKVGVTLSAAAASTAAATATASAASGSANSTAKASASAASASATSPASSSAAPASTAKASSASSTYTINALFGAVAAGVVALTL